MLSVQCIEGNRQTRNLHPWPELQIIHRSLCFPIFTHFSTSHSSSFSFLHTFFTSNTTVLCYHFLSHQIIATLRYWCYVMFRAIILYGKNPKVGTKNNLESPNMSQGICSESKFSRNLRSFVIFYFWTSYILPSSLCPVCQLFWNTFSVVNTNVIIALTTDIIFRVIVTRNGIQWFIALVGTKCPT